VTCVGSVADNFLALTTSNSLNAGWRWSPFTRFPISTSSFPAATPPGFGGTLGFAATARSVSGVLSGEVVPETSGRSGLARRRASNLSRSKATTLAAAERSTMAWLTGVGLAQLGWSCRCWRSDSALATLLKVWRGRGGALTDVSSGPPVPAQSRMSSGRESSTAEPNDDEAEETLGRSVGPAFASASLELCRPSKEELNNEETLDWAVGGGGATRVGCIRSSLCSRWLRTDRGVDRSSATLEALGAVASRLLVLLWNVGVEMSSGRKLAARRTLAWRATDGDRAAVLLTVDGVLLIDSWRSGRPTALHYIASYITTELPGVA